MQESDFVELFQRFDHLYQDLRKVKLSVHHILEVIFDRPLDVLYYYVWIISERPFIQELGNA